MDITRFIKPSEVSRKWYVIDAKGKSVGRVAAETAKILRGKHKASYTPHVDNGDFVVILNSNDIVLTGRKENTKSYYRHSGFVGGLKETSFKMMKEKKPYYILEHAVKGMLPKTRLGRKMFHKLTLVPNGNFNCPAGKDAMVKLEVL